MRRAILIIFTLSICIWAHGSLPRVKPEQVGLNQHQLAQADAAIEEAIKAGEIPGAVLAVVRHGKMAYLKAYGWRQLEPVRVPMTTNTIFDMASCSKAVSTATCAMILHERGLLDLEAPVSRYISGFDDANGTMQVRHLLTHTSGLPAYASPATLIQRYGKATSEVLLNHICSMRRDFPPGTDFQYSCLNFITLQHIIQGITGRSLRQVAQDWIFRPLKMKHTDYLPTSAEARRWEKLLAPTTWEQESWLRGQVHDPLARIMNHGISGNAGLFSTAEDIATFCAMMQNGGEWKGRRIMDPQTVQLLTTVPNFAAPFGRSYGWDVSSPYSGCRGTTLSPRTYCHTGFTGTSIVIDPELDISIILLTNSVHPKEGKSGIISLRKTVSNLLAPSRMKNNKMK